MNIDFSKLTKDTQELAYSTIAFTAVQRAAQLALSDILAEQKAAKNGGVDAANEFHSDVEGEDEGNEHTAEIGHDSKATFEEWCAVLATTNDQLVTLANGGKWPRPQDVTSAIDWMKKSNPAPYKPEQGAELRAMMDAHSHGRPNKLTEEEVKTLVAGEAQAKADFFAGLYAEHGDEIRDRIVDQMANTSALISFDTAFNNLPAGQVLQLVQSIIRKVDTKCDELLTGKRRNGSSSPVSKIPMLARASMMSVLRGDQDVVKELALKLDHAA